MATTFVGRVAPLRISRKVRVVCLSRPPLLTPECRAPPAAALPLCAALSARSGFRVRALFWSALAGAGYRPAVSQPWGASSTHTRRSCSGAATHQPMAARSPTTEGRPPLLHPPTRHRQTHSPAAARRHPARLPGRLAAGRPRLRPDGASAATRRLQAPGRRPSRRPPLAPSAPVARLRSRTAQGLGADPVAYAWYKQAARGPRESGACSGH